MSNQERRSARKDNYFIVLFLSYVCSLIFRIPLLYIIGEKGIAYFGIANELYIAIGCLFTYGLSKAVSSLVRFRVKREQYKNADKVLNGALVLALVTGIVSGVIIAFFGTSVLKTVVQLPLANLAVSMVAPAIIFQMLTGVFRGYFEGNGSRIPSIHSMFVETLFMISGGLTGALLLYKYGTKVSALLQNEDYAASYGAMGAAIGILAASFLGFLHMLVLYLMYRGRAGRQTSRDLQKNKDKGLRVIHMLIGTALPFAGYAFFFRIFPFIDGVFFIRSVKEEENAAFLWGNYYGKYLVIIGIISLLIAMTCAGQVKKIIHCMDREEYKMAKERMGSLVHQLAIIAVPASVFTAVLSENLLNLLFKGNNDDTALLVSWGSVIIVLFAFSILFADILIRLNNMRYVIGYGVIALIIHVIVLAVLQSNAEMSLTGVVISNIVSNAVIMGFGFVLTGRSLQYRQEWLHTVAFTIVSAAVSGIVIMLINRVLSPLAGTTISFAVCLPIGIIVYLILLFVTKSVTDNELENMSGGRFLIRLGRWMKLM